MIKWIKDNRGVGIFIIIFLFIFFIIIIPLLINKVYYLDAPFDFLKVGYDVSDILNYYSSILTFIGTVSLGVITVYQNYISQKKTDKINKLTLELQRKSMEMAERNYMKETVNENKKNWPKFEIENLGSNGRYMNLSASIKNVSENVVSEIKSLSFEVFNKHNNIITYSDKVKLGSYSLSSGEKMNIHFNNESLELHGENGYDSLKEISIIWSFQCEDSTGRIHYFRAKIDIEDSNKLIRGPWKVEKVG